MRLLPFALPLSSTFLVLTLASCSSLPSLSSSPEILSKDKVATYASKTYGGSSSRGYFPAQVSPSTLQVASSLSKDKHGSATYHDPSVRTRVVRATAYSCMENEPGAHGSLSAQGTTLKYGMVRSAAADWSRYPVGTKFKIKGMPYTYVVEDYGSALVGTNTVDIYHPNLSLMKKWGTRQVEINVIQWGSWERTVNILKGRRKYSHCNRMYTASLPHLARERRALVKND